MSRGKQEVGCSDGYMQAPLAAQRGSIGNVIIGRIPTPKPSVPPGHEVNFIIDDNGKVRFFNTLIYEDKRDIPVGEDDIPDLTEN